MIYNYNLAKGRLVTDLGANLLDRPLIRFATKPTWTIRFCAVSAGAVTALDVSDAVAWRAAVDRDHSTATEPMCRTLNNDIDQSAAASGEISVPLDANTATFLAAVDGKESLAAWFELWGLDGNGDAVYYVKFPISTGMPIDPASGEAPAAPAEQWADKTYLEARLAAGYEIELSDDGLTWYALELDGEGAPIMPDTAAWWHYRHRLAGGVWSDLIPLMRGPTGAKGDPFSFGAVGLLADRSAHDNEVANFTYLATDTGDVYYKLSATSADWSSAIPFAAADSLALKTDLENKVDKVDGKGLSTNDYSNEDKAKVDALGSMSAEDAADYRTAADQDLIDAGKVNSNAAITGATKTKITYDSKGLVTAGADLEESDIPNISASKVTGLATVATSGSYNDLSDKPLDRETVPMSITGYAVEGYPVARMDDVYDSIEIYKNAVGLAVVEMKVRSADDTITGNIILIPVINGVDGDPVTIAVTASWEKVSFALEIPAGTLAFRRDHASASDTLKDGASVITAQVIEITYRSSVL